MKLFKKEKCFLCEEKLDKDFGEIVYKYEAGEGKVQLCSSCMDKIEDNENDFSV